jgi:hypothetical protein
VSLQVDALGADSGKNNSFGGARGTRDGVLRELEAADDFDRPSCSCLVHLWLHWAADAITETVLFQGIDPGADPCHSFGNPSFARLRREIRRGQARPDLGLGRHHTL